VTPRERAFRRREQLAPERAIAGPLHRLGEEHHEERRRIDGPVVRAVRHLAEPRQLAAAELVEDLAWLLLGERVDLRSLMPREQQQRAARDILVPGERLVRRDDPVAAE